MGWGEAECDFDWGGTGEKGVQQRLCRLSALSPAQQSESSAALSSTRRGLCLLQEDGTCYMQAHC